MKGMIVRILINGIALMVVAGVIDGIQADGFMSILLASLVLGIVNAVIKPIIMILTLPLNVLTLGLLTFVINGFMLKITSLVVSGFVVNGFWAATLGAVLLSVVSSVLSWLISD